MNNFNKNIDKLVSRILNEEIEGKVKELSKKINEGEWTEVEMDEELKGGQKKIDVAKPKGKITSADFKKLRDAKKHKEEVEEYYHSNIKDLGDFEDDEDDMRKRYKMMDEPYSDDGDYSGMGKVMRKRYNKDMGISDDEDFAKSNKEEMDEFYFYDDEEGISRMPGDYEGDEDEEEEAEELSAQEPTYVGKGLADNKPGKMFGSFNDEHGFFDERDRQFKGDFDFDYDEEEFDNFDDFDSKYGGKQMMFARGNEGRKFFDIYKNKFKSPFRVRTPRDMGEQETEEGNAFSGALADAKKDGKDSFEVDGKKYQVKEAKEKWIQKTNMSKGALHKKLGIPEGDKIPNAKLQSLKKELMKKGEGDKKLSAADSKLLKQVNLALTLKSVKESKNSLRLTEDELIDMIEKIVLEQKVKDKAETSNIAKKEAEGLKKTNKVLELDKKENDDYAKEVVTKMKDYMKDMFMGGKGYDENPDDFPQSNYDMEKEHNEMKYHPSDAVEEYIEAFAYPGMTNLVYDEIKPDDKRIDKQLKGDATTGNAITGKDGKALGNVSKRSGEVGERFKKNYDENLYGAEQMKASYKRQPQPVEVEGGGKTKGSLKSKQGADKSSSINKATKILNTLESTEDKKAKIVSEEMNKMKNLISYDRKTQ